VNQKDSEQNEVDGMKKVADSTGKVNVMHYVRSGLCGCGELLCCFSVSAMAQWCGSTLVTDDSRLFTLSVDLRL